jgi:hypothetical protein
MSPKKLLTVKISEKSRHFAEHLKTAQLTGA